MARITVVLALLGGCRSAYATAVDQCSSVNTAIGAQSAPLSLTLFAGDVLTVNLLQAEVFNIYGGTSATGTPVYNFNGSGVGQNYTIPSTGVYTFTQTKHFEDPANVTCTAPGSYVFTVTVNTDPTSGRASNCTNNSTTDASCSLRDALTAAAGAYSNSTANSSTVQFSPTAFPAASTITLARGALTIPSKTTIQGLTSGTGATLTNLITVSGGGMTQVMNVPTTTTTATINNLTIANGSSQGSGAGIAIDTPAVVTINQSTFLNNTAAVCGGGIYNNGTLTLTNSTVSGNSNSNSDSGFGGGLCADEYGSVVLTNDTFSAAPRRERLRPSASRRRV